jgi:putative acyl-CoA dehydrogenase
MLRTHDRHGHRIDEVEFHPAWHALLDIAVSNGLHAAPWASMEPAPQVTRAAGFLVWSQAESGHGCPVSMTYAAVPAIRAGADLAKRWEPQLTSSRYDPGLRAPAEKAGLLAGMAMTEKQGGSDLRANSTRAQRTADDTSLLTGHKWFTSAPMNDIFLVLAQAPGGLSCFVVPRVLDDGAHNTFRIQRLKDKLGNRSNASAEIELEDTIGWRLGDEGRGVATIIEMVAATRLDCVLGSAALMRRATVEASWHCSQRRVFGRCS